MRIAVIGDRETVAGFRLAGVKESYIAEDGFSAQKQIKHLFNMPGIAVIFVTADLYSDISDMIHDRINSGSVYPIVVEIPPAHGEIKEDPIREIVRRAVGIDMEK